MALTHIDKRVAEILEQAVLKQLKPLEAELGIVIRPAGGRYTATAATLKFDFSIKAPTGEVLSKERESFKRNASLFGLKPEHLDQKFHSNYRTFKIIGLNPNAPKFAILAERSDGKRFKFPPSIVITQLKAAGIF
jgi:hypothetical protein